MPRAKKKDSERVLMNLPKSTRRLAEIVGNGDRTAGVERLFAQLPVFYKIRAYLELKAEEGDTRAESLLHDMEGIEGDRIYDECVCEGMIVPGEDGEPAAWII